MRVFFCADVPDEAKRQIETWVIDELVARFPGARWVPAVNYHITLNFIGSIERQQLPSFQNILRLLRDQQTFDVCGSRLIWLPDEPRRRVLALEVTSGGHLTELHRCLGGSGSFVGHITLARPAARMDPSQLLSIADASVRFKVVKLSLRQSVSSPEGVIYPALEELNLTVVAKGLSG